MKPIRTNDEIIQIIIDEKDKNNLSTSELARRVGMAKSAISRYLNKTREFPINRVNDFARVLGVSSEYILGFDESSSIETIYKQLNDERKDVVYSFAEAQLSEQHASKTVPIVGTTAANPQGIVNGDTVYDESISTDVPDKADAALTVKGDSMEPDFKNGSIVFYRKQPTIENGELAIVEIEGGVTFKKVCFKDDDVHLVSLNKKHEDKVIKKNDLKIVGKVVQ